MKMKIKELNEFIKEEAIGFDLSNGTHFRWCFKPDANKKISFYNYGDRYLELRIKVDYGEIYTAEEAEKIGQLLIKASAFARYINSYKIEL